MNIGLLNLEPYKNLALEKLRVFHKSKGDYVEDYFALRKYDKVYCSSIFTFTPKDIVPKDAICGGTGFDLTTKLPHEIDIVQPHINLGFTLRGCINKCPFCIVWRKEPDLCREATLLDIWDGIAKLVTLLDNNALADLEWFYFNCELAIKYKITLDWNQGLDHRLLESETVDLIKRTPHKELRFAFDNPNSIDTVDNSIRLLQSKGINRCLWYVLVGFNTTFEQDLFRLNYLRANKQNAYVQRYNYKSGDVKYIALAEWANQHNIFYSMSFEQFLDTPHAGHRKYNKFVKPYLKIG